MQFNGSVYFTDYESLLAQIFGFDTGVVIQDAGYAETKGFEAELTFAATDNLTLIAIYAHTDTEIVSGPLNGQH